MPPARFGVQQHNRGSRAEFTVVGDIDLTTVSLVRSALARCPRGLTRTVDVDLTAVGFCDVSALNAFLEAAENLGRTGAVLRLHHPPSSLVRVIDITGSGRLLGPPAPRPAGAGQGENRRGQSRRGQSGRGEIPAPAVGAEPARRSRPGVRS
ncbi:STAS domain-containing protein [Streptomyces sp. NPDC023723]|uniref:STAS domain-containing protein n=1 Tax=Streptomyces sp. NPDC023723 TaxID=3154323 RepID=UPI0033D4D0E7